jgi:opacity protein-like surface antigen
MNKIKSLMLMLFIGIAISGSAQAPAVSDFYVGKWDVVVLGTPQGDAKMELTLTRNEGKLTGEIKNPADSTSVPLTNVVEADGKVTIYFSLMGYDLDIPFEKQDDENIKGLLVGMFEAKAKRVK